ncbi:hypothetical protein BDF20DRAFT_880015 [Mycotypha africana]|uniref:uncharacterized protein n=1 Tax=Mycotypha africana TaxID=64632 RepID=UPI0023008D12|nr:uncharacterized protein BDF20DRAFT_880015 [Mycotypha africana]KAI8975674.1 hypothetical protein BDF20DRAFT_880015 [Mycotypha africana]
MKSTLSIESRQRDCFSFQNRVRIARLSFGLTFYIISSLFDALKKNIFLYFFFGTYGSIFLRKTLLR